MGKQITEYKNYNLAKKNFSMSFLHLQFEKNTAIFNLFGVEQVTPDKLSIYFNKLGCMVLPESFNK